MDTNFEDFEDIEQFNVVAFARQILKMDSQLQQNKLELKRLAEFEKKYKDLMDSSLKHSQVMAGNMVKMLLVPGVSEAFRKNAEVGNFSGAETTAEDQLLSSKKTLINTGRDDESALSANEQEMYEEVRFDLEVKNNPDLLL